MPYSRSLSGRFLLLLLTLFLAPPAAAAAPTLPPPLQKAVSLFEQGRFDAAQTRLEGRTDSAVAAYYLGRIALRRFDPYQAVDLLSRAVKGDGDNADYHYWLGRAYGRLAKRANIFQRAYYAGKTKDEFQRAVTLDPHHLFARVALLMYDLKAPGFLGGSRKEAEHQAEVVARQNPVAGLRARGLIHEQDEHFGKALADYRRAAKMAPAHDRPHRWLAGLQRRLGHFDKAFAIYERRMERKNPDWAARVGYARTALAADEHLEQAERHLRAYIAHNPGPEQPARAEARFLLGKVLQKEGRLRPALEAFRTALREAPHHPKARDALEAVRASLL